MKHEEALAEARKEFESLRVSRNECERYAGKLECALEHIRAVCKLAISSSIADQNQDMAELLDVIVALSRVKDDRSQVR